MFPLAGDINWMETSWLEWMGTKGPQQKFPLAGDINWMETLIQITTFNS